MQRLSYFTVVLNKRFSSQFTEKKIEEKDLPLPILGPILSDAQKINFSALDRAGNIGIASIWGRPDVAIFRQASNLTEPLWDTLFLQTIAQLEKNLESAYEKRESLVGGASLCGAFLCNGKVHLVHIGNCVAYRVDIRPFEESSITRLNPDLHVPSAPEEEMRLKSIAGSCVKSYASRVSKYTFFDSFGQPASVRTKLAGASGVSRALGLVQYEDDGLSHEPDIIHSYARTSPNTQSFIILATGGTIKNVAHPEDQILRIVSRHKMKTADEIAKAVTLEISGTYPQKNSSVAIIPITEKPGMCTQIEYAVVIDGIGNDQVSEAIAQQFERVFEEHCYQLLAHPESSDPSQTACSSFRTGPHSQ